MKVEFGGGYILSGTDVGRSAVSTVGEGTLNNTDDTILSMSKV
jgi:hypothetical protein